MKTALVCGAGGFIGGHLVEYLKNKGYWVRGVDIKPHEFRDLNIDEFRIADLRNPNNAYLACSLPNGESFDEVYQLAADMGGMGFIHSAETDIMRNNVLININMTHAAYLTKAKRYFYSSSVCVYRDMEAGELPLYEDEAFPAQPDNEYGWEKLYSERVALAYERNHGMIVRIARFQNCYGPYGTWRGGREKAPAAICRKVSEVDKYGTIEVWGDGTAIRNFIYVNDMAEAIYKLMNSELHGAVNIGTEEYVTVNELVDTVAQVAGKQIDKRYIDGPVGVQSRNFANDRIYSIGWQPQYDLYDGITETYKWINEQVQTECLKPQRL